MRILTRYVLFDLLRVFVLVLTALTLLIFIFLAGQQAVERNLGLGPLLRMMPYLLPEALLFAVPGTMLLATTYVYGRLSGYNEVVAVKSMGISPMVLIWPTLILATLVSMGTVVLNDVAMSWGRRGAERVAIESLEEVAYGQLRMYRSFRVGDYHIIVNRVDGDKLVKPTIIEQKPAGGEPATYTAEWAVLKAFPEQGNVRITMYDMEGSLGGDNGGVHPGRLELVQPIADVMGTKGGQRSPSYYALREIPQAKDEERNQIETARREMTTDAAFSLLAGQFENLSDDSWQAHESKLAGAEYRLHRFNTEPYRRWSNGFSCLSFVIVGAAMAIRLRQSDFLAIFFVCFMPILLVYYPLLMVSLDKAKGGALPPQAVWLGNIVLALWGAWTMRRVIRF